MTPQERDELLAELLSGKLPSDRRSQLAKELRADPAFAGATRELAALDRLLALELAARDKGAFTWKVTERIREIAEQGDEAPAARFEEAELSEAELEAVAGAGEEPPPPPPPEDHRPEEPPPSGDTPPQPPKLP